MSTVSKILLDDSKGNDYYIEELFDELKEMHKEINNNVFNIINKRSGSQEHTESKGKQNFNIFESIILKTYTISERLYNPFLLERKYSNKYSILFESYKIHSLNKVFEGEKISPFGNLSLKKEHLNILTEKDKGVKTIYEIENCPDFEGSFLHRIQNIYQEYHDFKRCLSRTNDYISYVEKFIDIFIFSNDRIDPDDMKSIEELHINKQLIVAGGLEKLHKYVLVLLRLLETIYNEHKKNKLNVSLLKNGSPYCSWSSTILDRQLEVFRLIKSFEWNK